MSLNILSISEPCQVPLSSPQAGTGQADFKTDFRILRREAIQHPRHFLTTTTWNTKNNPKSKMKVVTQGSIKRTGIFQSGWPKLLTLLPPPPFRSVWLKHTQGRPSMKKVTKLWTLSVAPSDPPPSHPPASTDTLIMRGGPQNDATIQIWITMIQT